MDELMDLNEETPTEGGSRPGPVYDTVLKAMFEFDLLGACRLLGIQVEGEPVALPTEFTLTKRIVDLLVQVGPNRLLHVEYARRATSDLVPRMLIYRGLVMQLLPKNHVTQHIVVLGEGVVSGYDDYDRNGFALDLRVHYLRDAEVDVLVEDVNFAPLAILKRGDSTDLEQVATRVIRAIQERRPRRGPRRRPGGGPGNDADGSVG